MNTERKEEMKKWEIYQHRSIQLGRRLLREARKNPKRAKDYAMEHWNFTEAAWDELMSRRDPFFAAIALSSMNEGFDEMDLPCAAMEFAHLMVGCPTLFIEDGGLLEMLNRSKFDIEASVLGSPWPVFSVCPPTGLKIEGVEIRPFLFKLCSQKESRQHIVNVLEFVGVKAHADGAETLMAQIQIGEVGWCDDWSSYIDRLNSQEGFLEIKGSTGDTSRHTRDLKLHSRLATALLVYVRAFPSMVREGFPKGVKERDRKFGAQGQTMRGKLKGISIRGLYQDGGGRAPCLVRAHFRSLHDERYKRDVDGGVRIIEVREHARGADIEPYTAA